MQTLSKWNELARFEGDGGSGDGDQTDSGDSKGKDYADKNPLLPDLDKAKERYKAAEQALADREAKDAESKKEQELKDATDKKELESVIERHKAESSARERNLSLKLAASEAGIPPEFATASDDGEKSIADVVKAAGERYKAVLADHDAGKSIQNMGGGSSPEGKDGRKFTRSQVQAMSLDEYKKLQPEIDQARKDGRFLKE